MSVSALRQAVYTALNHTSVTGLLSTGYGVAAVFRGHAPQVADGENLAYFPYVTFSFPSTGPFNDKGATGISAVVQVDVWSRKNTNEPEVIADAIRARLERQSLNVTGHVTTELESVDAMDDPDGTTRRIMLRFRVLALA